MENIIIDSKELCKDFTRFMMFYKFTLEEIYDIAGIRITCSFTTAIDRIKDMLIQQTDLEIIAVKD